MERTLSDRQLTARTSQSSNELLSVYDSGLPQSEKPQTELSTYLLILLAVSAVLFLICGLIVLGNRKKYTSMTSNILLFSTVILTGITLLLVSLALDKQRGNQLLGIAIAIMLTILIWFLTTIYSTTVIGLAVAIILLLLTLVFVYNTQSTTNILLGIPIILLPIVMLFTNWYIRV